MYRKLNRPASVGTPEPVEILLFEHYWSNADGGGLGCRRVRCNQDVPPGFFTIGVDHPANSFPLQSLKEAFSRGVFVAVAASAHAGEQVVGLEERLPLMTAELVALVGMDGHRRLGLSAPDGHQ